MKICTTCGTEYPDDQKFCPTDGTSLRGAAGTADLIGSVIAERYHIQKKLGEGGMGAVYLGEHVKMGRKSAIKVMAQSMANDPDAIARFNREAANAARINHPNVCQIYDFGETPDGVIYLAMEFIEGEALTELIEREGALAPARAAAIIRQAGDALQTAHDMGIVHRDLKPDNIMVSRGRAGDDVVKVVDFGIAKAMGGEEGQKVTKTGLVVGTPEYMSPEQLSGDTLDGRSDIYSLALVFYRMLTGTLPFQADSAQEVMIKRLTDEPMRLNEARPGGQFPPRLQEVIDQALQRMPADRYDSAARFAADAHSAVQRMSAQAAAPADDGATQLMDPSEIAAAQPSASSSAKTEPLARTRVAGEPAVAARPKTPDTAHPAPSPVPRASKKAPAGAIAAAVIGLAAVGGGAAVMFTGGDASTVPEDSSAVTGGTAPVTGNGEIPDSAGGGTERPVSRPANGRDTPPPVVNADTQRTAPVATVDSTAIDAELEMMIDQLLDPTQLPAVIERARAIFDNTGVPRNLRVSAAATVAAAYVETEEYDQVCRWYRLAADLLPPSEKDRYDPQLNALGCS